MTTSLYRALVVASLVVGVASAALDYVFPSLLSEQLRAAQASQLTEMSTPRLLAFLLLASIALVLYIASMYGLYRFRPWAPRIALICTAVVLVIPPLGGASAQSGVAIAAAYLSSYLWGAAIALAYVSPISARFSRRDDQRVE